MSPASLIREINKRKIKDMNHTLKKYVKMQHTLIKPVFQADVSPCGN